MSVIIRLQNLPWTASAMDIRNYFLGLNIPDGGVHIVGGDKGDAFIAFSTDEDARRAMLQDGGRVKDNFIKLFLSSKTEMQNVIADARRPAPQELAPPPPRQVDPYAGFTVNPLQNPAVGDMSRIPIFPAGMPVASVGLLPTPNMRGGMLDRPGEVLPTQGHPDRFINAGPDDGMRRPGPNGDAPGMQGRPFVDLRDGRQNMMNESRPRDFGMAERQTETRFAARSRDRRSRSRSPRHRSRGSRTRDLDDSHERSRGRSRDRERKRPERGSPRERERDRSQQDTRRDRENRDRFREDRKDNGRSSPRRRSPPPPPRRFEGPTHCVHVDFMPNTATYKDIRRFFRGLDIPRDGLRLQFDPSGRRARNCFVKFFKQESADAAVKMDGEIMEGSKVQIRRISEDEFNAAVSDDLSPGPNVNRPPREEHGPNMGPPPSHGSRMENDTPMRGPPGLDRRGPPLDHDRRGPPPDHDRRGPPPDHDRRGPPPDLDRRGPPPDHDGRGPPPDHDIRGPPGPDRRPPGPEGRMPGPEGRIPMGREGRGPPPGRGPLGPDRRGPPNHDRRASMGPDEHESPQERPVDIPHGRPGMPTRDPEGPRREFVGVSRHVQHGGPPPGPGHLEPDLTTGYCAVVQNLAPGLSRSELREFFGDQKLMRGGLLAECVSNTLLKNVAFFKFLREIDLEMAMKKNGRPLAGHPVDIIPISREEFETERVRIYPNSSEGTFRNGMDRGGPEPRRDGPPGPPRRGLLPHPGRGGSPPPSHGDYPGSEPVRGYHPTKTSPFCVRLHGLDFNSTVETVLDFLHGIPVKPEQVKLLYTTSGVSSGIAFIEFNNPVDHSRALERNKNYIGRRYINVSNISKEDAQREVEKFHGSSAPPPPRRGPSKSGPPGGSSGRSQGDGLPANTVFLANLPFSVSPEEVLDFLQGFGPIPDSLRFREEGGKRTGEAMIVLSHPTAVDKAVEELQGHAVRGRTVTIST